MTIAHEQEIVSQEDQLTRATRELDLETLNRMYADDILFTGVPGVVCDKAALMDEARRGVAERQAAAETKRGVVSYEKEDLRIAAHGDTAVTNYRFIVTITMDGQTMKRRFRTTNVWRKRQVGWQVIAGHTSSLEAQ